MAWSASLLHADESKTLHTTRKQHEKARPHTHARDSEASINKRRSRHPSTTRAVESGERRTARMCRSRDLRAHAAPAALEVYEVREKDQLIMCKRDLRLEDYMHVTRLNF